jgi:hypothetical protein
VPHAPKRQDGSLAEVPDAPTEESTSLAEVPDCPTMAKRRLEAFSDGFTKSRAPARLFATRFQRLRRRRLTAANAKRPATLTAAGVPPPEERTQPHPFEDGMPCAAPAAPPPSSPLVVGDPLDPEDAAALPLDPLVVPPELPLEPCPLLAPLLPLEPVLAPEPELLPAPELLPLELLELVETLPSVGGWDASLPTDASEPPELELLLLPPPSLADAVETSAQW